MSATLTAMVSWEKEIDRVIAEFSPPSTAAWNLYIYVAEGGSCLQRCVDLLSRDPLLATEVARLADAAGHGPVRESCLAAAAAALGCGRLARLALGRFVRRLAPNRLATYDLSAEAFYLKSVGCAAAMDYFYHGGCTDCSGDAHTVGLLHALGEIFIDGAISREKDEPIRLIGNPSRKLAVIEERFLGLNQATVAGKVLRLWGLPERIYKPIEQQFSGQHGEVSQALSMARYLGMRAMEHCLNKGTVLDFGVSAIFRGRPLSETFAYAVKQCELAGLVDAEQAS